MADNDHIQRKNLRRERKRRYRKGHRTFSLNFPLDAAYQLEKRAKRQRLSVPKYIKAVLKAEDEANGYVLPPDSKLHDLIISLRRIGTNINQHTRYVNATNQVTASDIEYLRHELARIEAEVIKALSQPPEIIEVIANYLHQHPERLSSIIHWLNQFRDDNKDNAS